jgi:hypothetical protein
MPRRQLRNGQNVRPGRNRADVQLARHGKEAGGVVGARGQLIEGLVRLLQGGIARDRITRVGGRVAQVAVVERDARQGKLAFRFRSRLANALGHRPPFAGYTTRNATIADQRRAGRPMGLVKLSPWYLRCSYS